MFPYTHSCVQGALQVAHVSILLRVYTVVWEDYLDLLRHYSHRKSISHLTGRLSMKNFMILFQVAQQDFNALRVVEVVKS
jgi:hypothetical protein